VSIGSGAFALKHRLAGLGYGHLLRPIFIRKAMESFRKHDKTQEPADSCGGGYARVYSPFDRER
jgi:hypothetical protein